MPQLFHYNKNADIPYTMYMTENPYNKFPCFKQKKQSLLSPYRFFHTALVSRESSFLSK